jgi:2-C-methyl-D-erythritol 4-phosphate cytidylyltransferase
MSSAEARRLFALVPAAGAGRRMDADLPKQYLSLRGRPLAEQTLHRLLALARVERIMVAVADDDPWWPSLAVAGRARVATTRGGASRAESVRSGLAALAGEANDDDLVLVHDMARPCVRLSDIEQLLAQAGGDGAILARVSTDTLKQADADGGITATLERASIWRAQTPQLFPLGLLRRALDEALAAGVDVTDEASAVEWLGRRPLVIAGSADNLKVTQPADLALAEFYLTRQEEEGVHWGFG